MLRRGHSHIVGLLVPDVTNEFYAAVAQRLAEDCSERGQQLVLLISADDPDRELALVHALLEARPSGLIAAVSTTPRPETLAYLRGTYCVQFMQVHPEIEGPVVTVEDSGGARIAMEHLLQLGHRRIGFVGPTPALSIGDARLRGLNEALQAAGIKLDGDLIRLGPSTADFGFGAVDSLLALPEPPTAICLSSAPLSLGGVRALSAQRVRIPEDISVVVAGSTAWYDAWPGGLTSVTLPMAELADTAAAFLQGGPRKSTEGAHPYFRLSFGLIERGSTAAPVCAR
jgi:LacI family transcriptional regulator